MESSGSIIVLQCTKPSSVVLASHMCTDSIPKEATHFQLFASKIKKSKEEGSRSGEPNVHLRNQNGAQAPALNLPQ